MTRGGPCPYCAEPTYLRTGAQIYPYRLDLYENAFWACEPCGAWVGCHPGTITPLGRLANRDLRALKQAAHQAFDPLWQSGHLSRTKAYVWLAGKLGIPPGEAHIGRFDEATCQRVIDECGQFPWPK